MAVAALAFLAFANTLGHGLVYDDKLILWSPLVRDPWNLRALFTSEYYDSPKGNLEIYRPLTNATFVLNYAINRWISGDGADPFGFHLATVTCHVFASVLVFAWLDRLGAAPAMAWTAALLFAVHPLHSEAVANVSGRSEPLAAAFGLAFLIVHRRGHILGAAGLYLCALWSKESAIAFLPVAVLVDWLVPVGAPARRMSSYAACALTLLGWFLLRAGALSDPPSPISFIDNPLVRVSTLERVLTAAKVQLMYLRLEILPFGLSTDYSFDHVALARGPLDPAVLGCAGVVLLASYVAVRSYRATPFVAVAIVAYGLCWAVTSNVFITIGTLMAERLAYAPSIFVCLLASLGAWSLARHVGTRAIVVAIGLCTLAGLALTVAQNRVWRDESSLYRDQVRTAPDSAKSHLNLAQNLVAAGDLAAAAAEYETSLRIAPDYAWSWYLLGDTHARLNERDRAIEAWRRAIEVDPAHIEARVRLIGELLALGRRSPALPHMTELVARDPRHPELKDLLERAQRASSLEERRAARAELEQGRERAAQGDLAGAVALHQRAFRSFALKPEDRRACLTELCAGLHGLGRPKLEAAWREVARALE